MFEDLPVLGTQDLIVNNTMLHNHYDFLDHSRTAEFYNYEVN